MAQVMTAVTPTAAPRRAGVRLLLMLVVFVPGYVVAGTLNQAVSDRPVLALPIGIASAAALLGVYVWAVRRWEHRPAAELAGARRTLIRGFGLGAVLFTALLGLIAVFGGVDHVEGGSVGALVASVGTMAFAATAEELLFRGIVFRLLGEMVGFRWALVLSAALFGGLHLLNPHATVWGAVAIAVEAGLMLGALYVATRSLWFVIGVHFAWNLFEGGLFGTEVSGSGAGGGLMHTVLEGPALLTGGGFGPEASLLAIAVCLVPTVLALRRR